MTRVTPRVRWRQSLEKAPVPASLRPMRGTLLALASAVSPAGDLCEWRDDLTAATGLPVRTLTRHLEQAVTSGWLVREVAGGHGRRSRYRVTIPGVSCEPSTAHNCPGCGPPARTQLPEVVGQLVAHSIKTEHSRQRVPGTGTRRSTRQATPSVGSRASQSECVRTSGSNGSESVPANPPLLSLVQRRSA